MKLYFEAVCIIFSMMMQENVLSEFLTLLPDYDKMDSPSINGSGVIVSLQLKPYHDLEVEEETGNLETATEMQLQQPMKPNDNFLNQPQALSMRHTTSILTSVTWRICLTMKGFNISAFGLEQTFSTIMTKMVKLFVFVRMNWTENRMKLNKSHIPDYQVVVNPSYMDKLWKPDLVFVPSDEVKSVSEMGYQLLYVTKDNVLRMTIITSVRLLCKMHFGLYPLDIQNCSWSLSSMRYTSSQLNLIWSDNPIDLSRLDNTNGHKLTLPRFEVQFLAEPRDRVRENKPKRLHFRMVFSRSLINHILVTYFPSTLLVVISWFSFLVSPEIVPGRMVLLVTNLLSLVTMFFTVRHCRRRVDKFVLSAVGTLNRDGFVEDYRASSSFRFLAPIILPGCVVPNRKK